jgi:DNA polymerase III epsilon subunit-like protein
MKLFFDTETTGFTAGDRLVQIAWQIYDDKDILVEQNAIVVRPDGFTIPWEASRIHGFTTEFAVKNGQDLRETILLFTEKLKSISTLVAHNISYDLKVLNGEYKRLGIENPLSQKKQICTMKSSTNYCKIPSQRGFKWPKLEELYKHLFDKSFSNAHKADADVSATAQCFFELQKRGVI